MGPVVVVIDHNHWFSQARPCKVSYLLFVCCDEFAEYSAATILEAEKLCCARARILVNSDLQPHLSTSSRLNECREVPCQAPDRVGEIDIVCFAFANEHRHGGRVEGAIEEELAVGRLT